MSLLDDCDRLRARRRSDVVCKRRIASELFCDSRQRHLYEVRPRKDNRGVDLISDALPFGRLWYGEPNAAANAVDYAKFYSHSDDAVNEFLIRTSLS